jgi:predicted metalloprotease with PDZ domain
MTRLRRLPWVAHLLRAVGGVALLCCVAIPAHATISYSVSLANRDGHRFHVTMSVPNATGQVTVRMAAWNALYQIRDFAYRISSLAAHDTSGPAAAAKIDKDTWSIAAHGTLTIEYDTDWNDTGPFACQLDSNHAFINPAMILLYVPERRAEDVRIAFTDAPSNWHAAVELPAAENGGALAFTAPNFDDLSDAPFELGTFDEFEFQAGGRPIRVAISGRGWKRDQLTDILTRIVNNEVAMMGETPFREYLFLFHVGDGWGGGMEHMNSTAIDVGSMGQLPGVAAHELFHAWNVKRLRPATLEPLDDQREMYTRALWFAEGVTNTYEDYVMVRTGLWERAQFYDEISQRIAEIESRPAHTWQSVEQSSLDAWLEKYPLYTDQDFSVSYYDKGELLGLLLDIQMREVSGDRVGLDDLMRAMYADFALKHRFYNDSVDIRAAAEEVLRKAGVSGVDADLGPFFAKYVAGAAEIPFADLLADAGLSLESTSHNSPRSYRIVEMPAPSDLQLRIRNSILAGSTAQAIAH